MNRAGAFDVCLVDEAAQSMEAELRKLQSATFFYLL